MQQSRIPVGHIAGCALALLFAACFSSPPPAPARYTIEQFLDSAVILGGTFSPDESHVLYSSDSSGTFNLYSAPVDGGEPEQLTNSQDQSYFAESYFPADQRILFAADRAGNELYHIYLREPDGTIRDLTPGDEHRALFNGWSHDRQRFYFTWNRRDPQAMDLYAMDIATLEPRLLYQNDEKFYIGPVSPQQDFLTLIRIHTDHDTDLYLHNLASGETRHATPHEGAVSHSPSFFSTDGQWLHYLTDAGEEFQYAARLNVATLARETVKKADWSIVSSERSRNGTYVLYTINADARTELEVYRAATGQAVDLGNIPQGSITQAKFSDSEEKLLFRVLGDRTPGDLYVAKLGDASHARLTDTLSPEIDPEDLVDTNVVRYTSYDGLEVPAILLKPHLAPGEKAPALVEVHGGPGGQSRTGYTPLYQYLANHGYVILRVNNRGSSGYGKTFFKMDDRKHGDADLKDCIWGKKYLQSLDYVDPERIGIIGGSYGGYMVLAALAFTPDEFAVGVDIFGVANWLRTLKSIPPWWTAMRDALYDELGNPETDEEYLRKISPLFHANQIRKPLMVLQGANDPRVLKVESDEIVEAVKENGVPVEYLVFEDEGHGFKKKENRVRGYKAIRQFLDTYLKTPSTQPGA